MRPDLVALQIADVDARRLILAARRRKGNDGRRGGIADSGSQAPLANRGHANALRHPLPESRNTPPLSSGTYEDGSVPHSTLPPAGVTTVARDCGRPPSMSTRFSAAGREETDGSAVRGPERILSAFGSGEWSRRRTIEERIHSCEPRGPSTLYTTARPSGEIANDARMVVSAVVMSEPRLRRRLDIREPSRRAENSRAPQAPVPRSTRCARAERCFALPASAASRRPPRVLDFEPRVADVAQPSRAILLEATSQQTRGRTAACRPAARSNPARARGSRRACRTSSRRRTRACP